MLLTMNSSSIFDGNRAPDGAAINAAHYGAKFDNVTFKNNRESTIRVSFTCVHCITYGLKIIFKFNEQVNIFELYKVFCYCYINSYVIS